MTVQPVAIAHPDVPAAQEALTAYQGQSASSARGYRIALIMNGVSLLVNLAWLAITAAAYHLILVNLFNVVAAFVAAALMIWMGSRLHRHKQVVKHYEGHLAAGNIVLADPMIIDVWDELRQEEQVPLTGKEREVEIRQLYYAVKDLSGDPELIRSLEETGTRPDDRRMLQARLRARLLQEVRAYQRRQAEERQLLEEQQQLLLEGRINNGLVPQEDLLTQLEILRQREKEQER